MYQPKILLLDIENTPELGYSFGVHEVDILEVKEHSYILSVAYQWFGIDKRVKVRALCDYEGYKTGPDCEEKLVREVWGLFDKADIIVAQNGDAFDIKKLNARFAYYRLDPPKPYKTIDTLKGLRAKFGLPSNKLDEACKFFNIGGKLPHTGKHLWLGCMSGDRKAWAKMKAYNKHDVELLRELYLLLRPWIKHPSLILYTGGTKCPTCLSTKIQSRGYGMSASGSTFRRFRCMECGAWCRGNPEKGEKLPLRVL